MKQFFSILIMTIFVITVNAQTFYIAPNGNDANNGSQASPWKTLSKATSTVTAGIIRVVAGTYTETITSNLKTSVSLQGDGMSTTIIKSNISGQWSTFLNLESGSVTNGNQTISGITFDGGYVSETNFKTWIGIWITFRSNVIFRDCKVQGFYNRGMIWNGNGDNRSTIPKDPGIYTTGNKVINCEFNNTAGNDGTIYGMLNIGGQKDMEISGNTMIQIDRPAGKNGEPIKYWGSGYNLGLKILNNILKRANFTGSSYNGDGDWNFAIELFNQSGLEISGNTIQGSIDLSYSRVVSPHTYSVWIHDNTIDHTPANTKEEQGIIFEFETAKAIVENNKIFNVAMGITFNVRTPNENGGYDNIKPVGGYSAVTDVIIRNNLIAKNYSTPNSSAGIQFLTEGDSKDAYARNLLIHNNTFTTLSGDAAAGGIDLSHFQKAINGTPGASGITIRNNIFQGYSAHYLEGGSTQMVNIVTQDNVLWQNGNNNNPNWLGSITNTGNQVTNPQLDANYNSPIVGVGYNSGNTPPPPTQCVFTFGSWSACVNGKETRTYTASPIGCSGTPPTDSLTRSCTIQPPASDTTFCTIIVHLQTTGNLIVKRNTKYFIKKSDGDYDDKGVKLSIHSYFINNKWSLK